MTRLGIALSLLVLFSPILADGGIFSKTLVERHEHPSREGHRHDDADDHNEGPDSPCHSPIQHCCCSNIHVLTSMDDFELIAPQSSRIARLPDIRASLDPFSTPPFHVPLA